MCARRADAGPVIDLFSLASTLKDEGLELPLLFRFPDIVCHRLHQLQVGCLEAIDAWTVILLATVASFYIIFWSQSVSDGVNELLFS